MTYDDIFSGKIKYENSIREWFSGDISPYQYIMDSQLLIYKINKTVVRDGLHSVISVSIDSNNNLYEVIDPKIEVVQVYEDIQFNIELSGDRLFRTIDYLEFTIYHNRLIMFNDFEDIDYYFKNKIFFFNDYNTEKICEFYRFMKNNFEKVNSK